MQQDTVIISDDNAEEIIDTILQNIFEGVEPKSDLEKMVHELAMIDFFRKPEECAKYRNKIVEYIQSFYV